MRDCDCGQVGIDCVSFEGVWFYIRCSKCGFTAQGAKELSDAEKNWNEKKEFFDQEKFYDEEIFPLMTLIIDKCKEAGIPFVASFMLSEILSCSTVVTKQPAAQLDCNEAVWIRQLGSRISQQIKQ